MDGSGNQGITTLDPQTAPAAAAHAAERSLCLVVLAWDSDPQRVGQVLLPSAREAIFGRDDGGARRARLRLVRQRPGACEPSEPLDDRYLSREQLELGAASAQRLWVRRLGKRPLLCNGRELERCTLRAGDRVEIQGVCLFLCVERPRELPSCPSGHAFGEPDADGLVGESAEAWALRQRIERAASRSAHVLITGPSGSGKELVARAIHRRSERGRRALVARNAATIPPSLAVAELFGNAPSYPNAGMSERPGLIGQADGSTLFLDELGELPLEVQPNLLRVLDAGEYHRLGDARPRSADVRFIAATNRAPSELKPDLAARFALRIAVPGLGRRPEDVPLIARHLLRSMAQGDASIARKYAAGGELRLSFELIERLVLHAHETHCRELERLLWLSVETSAGGVLECTDEVAAALSHAASRPCPAPISEPVGALPNPRLRGMREPIDATEALARRPEAVSREELRAALDRHAGVKDAVWRELGLSSRHVLTRLMRKHGEG